MHPFSLSEIADDLGISLKNNKRICGFAIDSRQVKPGDLFFALPGNRVDGHRYLQEALQKGAIGAVVKQDFNHEFPGLTLLHVPDVLKALQELARKRLSKRKTRVVGITGSIGKTTTKEFASHLLSLKYRVGKSPLSYNSQATLPLSILENGEEDELLVLEMGMSEPGEISQLVSIAPPDIAVITTVALQHATSFPGGISSIAKEKGQIFSHPKTKVGILHRDIDSFDELHSFGEFKKISFSTKKKEADYFLEETPEGVKVYSKENKPIEIPLKLPLRAHYQNFLSAFVIALELGVPVDAIQEGIKGLKLPPMRFEMVEKRGVLFINDAYNANPDAMQAALEALSQIPTFGRKIAVLSEMNALGPFSEREHEKMARIALSSADMLLCLGSQTVAMERVWRWERRFCLRFQSKEELVKVLSVIAKPGDIVLLKGARAWALEEILANY